MRIDKKMAQAVRLFPLAIAALFSTILLTSSFSLYQEKENFLSTHIHQDFKEKQKRKIVARSTDMKIYSRHQAKTIYETIAKRVNTRLDLALRIAENIYNANREKPVAEITARIVTAFKTLHYQQSDAYFFLCNRDGTDLLALSAAREGRSEGTAAWSLMRGDTSSYNRLSAGQDYRGQELQSWWFPKQNSQKGITYKKAGKLFHFLPCDLFIGTGDYVDSSRAAQEQESLNWIKNVYAKEFNQVVVFDKKGAVRFSKGKDLTAGQQIDSFGWQINGKPLQFSVVEKMKKNGQFITLANKKESLAGEFYLMRLPQWNWAIVTSAAPNSITTHLQQKLSGLRQHNTTNTLLLLGGCIILIVLTIWGTVTISRRINAFLSEKLMYDELTGLPNRSYFLLRAKPILAETDCASVVNIDIDNFSCINERYSREAGDMLLRQIAQRLRSIFPPSQLCRMEGDEFFIFFPEIARRKKSSPCSSTTKIDTLRVLCSQPFFLDGSQIQISFSSGCCGKYYKGLTLEELMRRASIALFRAKETGRESHKCYTDIEWQIKRDKALADSFPGAIENGEISMVYQPLCHKDSDTVFRLEALSRWHHPELGEIGPEEFIPIAEKNGFMLLFSHFLVEKVCVDILAIEKKNGDKPVISINITSRQLLDANFIKSTINIMDKTGIPRDCIKLEIRENLLSSDTEMILPIMKKLQQAGLEMTLDDFGTGAFSLSHINKIPIKELKIDRSFIAGLPDDEQSVALVRSIIAIAAANNLRVIAEGVENKAQSDWLAREGCSLMQGFFCVRPLNLEELLLWCEENSLFVTEKDHLPPEKIFLSRIV